MKCLRVRQAGGRREPFAPGGVLRDPLEEDTRGRRNAARHFGGELCPSFDGGAHQTSALLQENMHLSRVLGDGPKQSGGLHQDRAVRRLPLALQNLASELLNQYSVSYTLPEGAKRSDRISISVKRKGVQVRAPSRVSN